MIFIFLDLIMNSILERFANSFTSQNKIKKLSTRYLKKLFPTQWLKT